MMFSFYFENQHKPLSLSCDIINAPITQELHMFYPLEIVVELIKESSPCPLLLFGHLLLFGAY